MKAGGGTGEGEAGQWTAASHELTTHTHTHTPGMKQVFNKPLVDESINSWTDCE